MGKPKARYFGFLLYKDSAPEDYVARITAIGQPVALSPWHDKDKTKRMTDDEVKKEAKLRATRQCKAIDNPIDRQLKMVEAEQYWTHVVHMEQANLPEYKKPHRHAIYIARNPVTADSVRRKLQRALGDQAVAMVQIIDNVQGAYLYLTHESADAKAKNKHVYDRAGIELLNNFDITRYVEMDAEEKMDLYVQLIETVERENIVNMKQLIHYIEANGESIGIPGVRELIKITAVNMGFLRALFDGNYQSAYRQAMAAMKDREEDEA
jgi:hypothetical protein